MLNPSATSRAEKTLHATTIEFAELLADIKKRSEEFEQQKYIPADIISRFKRSVFIARLCQNATAAMKYHLRSFVS